MFSHLNTQRRTTQYAELIGKLDSKLAIARKHLPPSLLPRLKRFHGAALRSDETALLTWIDREEARLTVRRFGQRA